MWPFRPAQKKIENLPDKCFKCGEPYRWRMNLFKIVTATCADHVDEALDRYVEIKKGMGK